MSIKTLLRYLFTPHPEDFGISSAEMINPGNAALFEAVRSQMPEEKGNGLGVQVDGTTGGGGVGDGDVVHYHPDSSTSVDGIKVLSYPKSARKGS